MRLIDADYVTEKLNEINGTAELDKAFEVVEDAPTVCDIDAIREEIAEYKDDKVIHAERNEMVDIVLEIIDRYTGADK